MLMGLFILIPTLSTIICSAFPTSEFDNGDGTRDTFLTADLLINVDSDKYKFIFGYAVAMVIVFPVSEGGVCR